MPPRHIASTVNTKVNTTQYNTKQHNTKVNTTQHNTKQHNTTHTRSPMPPRHATVANSDGKYFNTILTICNQYSTVLVLLSLHCLNSFTVKSQSAAAATPPWIATSMSPQHQTWLVSAQGFQMNWLFKYKRGEQNHWEKAVVSLYHQTSELRTLHYKHIFLCWRCPWEVYSTIISERQLAAFY